MMIRLVDIATDEDKALYREVLEKIKDGHVVGTLKQAIANPNGGYNYADLQQEVTRQQSIIQINGKYVYFTLMNLMKSEALKFHSIQRIVLGRGTHKFEKGEPNDYIYAVDLILNELELGWVYMLTGLQPIFMSSETEKDLTFVFDIEDVRCMKEPVTIYDVEYEQSIRDEMGDEVHKFDNHNSLNDDFEGEGSYVDDEGFDLYEGEDAVNTDEFTTGM